MAKIPKPALIALTVLFVMFIAVTGYFYAQNRKTKALLANPTEAAKQEATDLVTTIGKIVKLPVGEEPTIATVSDKDKLKDQAFFAEAENGDKVLVYSSAKKAILYRPSISRVIEMAPVNVNAPPVSSTVVPGSVAGTSTASAEQSPTPTVVQKPLAAQVAVYNGTGVKGLAATVESKLKIALSWVQVIKRGNAAMEDYEKTVVVDIAGKPAEAAAIATQLGVSVSPLPAPETKPEADILVIVGKDKVQ